MTLRNLPIALGVLLTLATSVWAQLSLTEKACANLAAIALDIALKRDQGVPLDQVLSRLDPKEGQPRIDPVLKDWYRTTAIGIYTLQGSPNEWFMQTYNACIERRSQRY